jgi:hypothetical protein
MPKRNTSSPRLFLMTSSSTALAAKGLQASRMPVSNALGLKRAGMVRMVFSLFVFVWAGRYCINLWVISLKLSE